MDKQMFNNVDGKGFSDAFGEVRGLARDMRYFLYALLGMVFILGMYYLYIKDKNVETERIKIEPCNVEVLAAKPVSVPQPSR